MFFTDVGIKTKTTHKIEHLSETDALAMLTLARLTKPGPFENRTQMLGEYYGVKLNGDLIAMAGERLKQPGFTEISGVCTHPDYQGRGLARELCSTLVSRILDRGETPYLHTYTSNAGAIKLYEKFGFETRRTLHVAQLEAITNSIK